MTSSEKGKNWTLPPVRKVPRYISRDFTSAPVALPSRTQAVKASSKTELNLQNLIKTLKLFFFSRTMCLGFTITASWNKMPLMTRKLSFTSEVKFVYLSFLLNFYFVNHLNNTKSQQMLLTS
jgi:hypothetical protein